MINHRYKKDWITDSLDKEGYLVKQTCVGKLLVKTKDDKKHICNINYETLRIEFEKFLGDDIELAVTSILEVCEHKMKRDGIISKDCDGFTVV